MHKHTFKFALISRTNLQDAPDDPDKNQILSGESPSFRLAFYRFLPHTTFVVFDETSEVHDHNGKQASGSLLKSTPSLKPCWYYAATTLVLKLICGVYSVSEITCFITLGVRVAAILALYAAFFCTHIVPGRMYP